MKAHQSLAMALPVHVRLCEERDLPKLEWFGTYTANREIIHMTFEAQEHGNAAMLVAMTHRQVIGKLWIDFKRSTSAGFLQTVRVLPGFQRHGVGRRLLATAEDLLIIHGFAWAEVTVDPGNTGGQRFLKACGFHPHGHRIEAVDYKTHRGTPIHEEKDRIIFRKRLAHAQVPRTPHRMAA